jgi:hypothetical protein
LLTSCLISAPALADEPLKGRAEVNWRYGSERSILMSEFWVPIAQDEDGVFYGDLRMMGDDQDNREGNLGVGYRQITSLPFLDTKGVVGINGWLDRRITERGSKFHQVTTGVEWLGESVDLRLNGYIPLSDAREIEIPNANPQAPALSGTGIVVDTNGKVLEEPQHGFDIELGWELGSQFDFIRENTDSFRVYGGAYYFDGDHTENVAGWRTRFTADISENVQLGARFQRDDERGSQGFLEATFRFPFGHKKSYRREGLRARLDESPERDIDIVTGDVVTDTGDSVAVVNKATGQAQEVLTVDNTAAGGGDGSAENPFNTLADAQAAASAYTIIYVKRGDGTSANQNQGIALNQTGQQLIGSGTNFVYDAGKFTTANGLALSAGTTILNADPLGNPTITNGAGNGVDITADDIVVQGITVDGAANHNISISNADNITISNVTATNAGAIGINGPYNDGGAHHLVMSENMVRDNAFRGVVLTAKNNTVLDVAISGNSISNNGDAAVFLGTSTGYNGADQSAITGTVSANTITENGGGSGHGLWLRSNGGGIFDMTITENVIADNELAGLLLQGISVGTNTTVVSGNTITGNGGDGVNATAYGTSTITSSLSGNTITGNTGYGVSVSNVGGFDMGGGTQGSAGGNRLFNNSLEDLRVTSAIGSNIAAENNWWGDPAGLQPANVLLLNGSTVDADPWLATDPGP